MVLCHSTRWLTHAAPKSLTERQEAAASMKLTLVGGLTSRTRGPSSRIADLEQAQEIAEKTGVGYQTVLKQAIRRGLKRAG
jgi:hypothetical protein